mmetsp:Transcript_35050/g.112591  ORF Transcript_35050/g.112591 Transcript_35050/m.112591 type:complete len:234 (+) Transcript_35050:860-1561(+)
MTDAATERQEVSTPCTSCCHCPPCTRYVKPCSTASERLGTDPNAASTFSLPSPERIMTWFFGSAQSVCSALSTRCGTTWPSVESRVSYRPASAGVSVPPQSRSSARCEERWNLSSDSTTSSGLKPAPIPTMRKLERPKPTETKSSSRFVCVALRSVTKRFANSSSVQRWMCAKSLRPRASRSAGAIRSAVSSASTSSFCEFGLTRRPPLSTRAKPENSERTSTPAGKPRKWRE